MVPTYHTSQWLLAGVMRVSNCELLGRSAFQAFALGMVSCLLNGSGYGIRVEWPARFGMNCSYTSNNYVGKRDEKKRRTIGQEINQRFIKKSNIIYASMAHNNRVIFIILIFDQFQKKKKIMHK